MWNPLSSNPSCIAAKAWTRVQGEGADIEDFRLLLVYHAVELIDRELATMDVSSEDQGVPI